MDVEVRWYWRLMSDLRTATLIGQIDIEAVEELETLADMTTNERLRTMCLAGVEKYRVQPKLGFGS